MCVTEILMQYIESLISEKFKDKVLFLSVYIVNVSILVDIYFMDDILN